MVLGCVTPLSPVILHYRPDTLGLLSFRDVYADQTAIPDFTLFSTQVSIRLRLGV